MRVFWTDAHRREWIIGQLMRASNGSFSAIERALREAAAERGNRNMDLDDVVARIRQRSNVRSDGEMPTTYTGEISARKVA